MPDPAVRRGGTAPGPAGRLPLLATFTRDRWQLRRERPGFRATAARHLHRFLAAELAASDFYRPYLGAPLDELPVVDKEAVLADFAAFNRYRIDLDTALAAAAAEERQPGSAPLPDGVVAGLSSGTSGRRGVFLVAPGERRRWAGTVLAQVLAPECLRQICTLGRPPLRVALLLRANSGLYETLGSRRLAFHWLDLHQPLAELARRLTALSPHVLAGPPSVLRLLAEEGLDRRHGVTPLQLIAVAETLEPDDLPVLEGAFGCRVDQIYQATEGLLGVSCPRGRVHLNERYVHFEPEWLDGQRFQPRVTDFSRTTQFVVRYRLDDVLLDGSGPCACGRPGRSLAAVLGRSDDVLTAPGREGAPPVAVYPDVLRRALALAGAGIEDYRIEQRGRCWAVALRAADPAAAAREVEVRLRSLWAALGAEVPELAFPAWSAVSAGAAGPAAKRRRLRRLDGEGAA